MKVLFDVLGSTEKSGGMRLHSTEIVGAWLRLFPDDEVIVIGGSWAREHFKSLGANVLRWPNEGIVGRASGQLFWSAIVAAFTQADAVVSLSPIVSPLVRRRRSACFQHDWRHKKNPAEFPWHQRAYRYLWEFSARRAGVNVCISQKAQEETVKFAPTAKTVVIENGRDHARDWPRFDSIDSRRIATFGHHNNKRPELVIDALPIVIAEVGEPVRLTVLGARGAYADSLRALAHSRGLDALVDFPGFVSDLDYQRLVSTAAAIVMPSSDEGFGLPIAEAEFLGIPAIVTNDSGMAEIFGNYPIVADPRSESIARAVVQALHASDLEPRHTRPVGTWADAARSLRDVVADSVPQMNAAAHR